MNYLKKRIKRLQEEGSGAQRVVLMVELMAEEGSGELWVGNNWEAKFLIVFVLTICNKMNASFLSIHSYGVLFSFAP
jgi:hypothetical protein